MPVSDNFFDVLGVQPALGRIVQRARRATWNGPKAVMLGHGLWQRRFNSDPAIVGTALTLNDEPHTVVGVLPASFDFAIGVRAGQPVRSVFPVPAQPRDQSLGQHDGDDRPAEAGRHGGAGAGRDPRRSRRSSRREHPERNTFGGFVKPLAEQVSGRIRLAVLGARRRGRRW